MSGGIGSQESQMANTIIFVIGILAFGGVVLCSALVAKEMNEDKETNHSKFANCEYHQ